METTEVLIVGAGPVGLTLALECARHEVAFRIIDAAPHPSDKSKALAIWSSAQEVFSALGVLERMREEGFHPGGLRVCSGKKTLLRIPSGAHVDSPFPDVVLLPQSSTEKILLDKLQERGHRVERPMEFCSLTQDSDGVEAVLKDADGSEHRLRSQFLAGCDGAHSAVRHAVGASFDGKARPECFVLCDAEVSGNPPLPPDVMIFVSKHGALPMFPIRDKIWRIVSTREEAAGTATPTLEEMQEHLAERGPGAQQLSNPEWLSCFRISERKVNRFRHGRVLLAGDAAHIHSPAGGQGMNTGVQDAFNLGWKLGYILRRNCDAETLLESYHRERSPVAEKVVQEASLRTRLALLSRGPMAALRNVAATALGHSSRFLEKLAVSFAGTSIHYPHSPLTLADRAWDEDWRNHGFAPGRRVRDAKVIAEDAEISLLEEILKARRFSLILFSGRRPNYRDADLLEGIRQEAAGLSSRVTTLAVWKGDHAPDESWLLDPSGNAHRRFGAEVASACLVRPDGYAVIRTQPADFKPISEFLSKL